MYSFLYIAVEVSANFYSLQPSISYEMTSSFATTSRTQSSAPEEARVGEYNDGTHAEDITTLSHRLARLQAPASSTRGPCLHSSRLRGTPLSR